MRPSTLIKPLAAAMLTGGLLAAPSVQGALVITSATRSVSADTSLSAPQVDSRSDTSGDLSLFVVSSPPGPNSPFAQAVQNSSLGALDFFGTGAAEVGLADGARGSAESLISVFFTLTSSFSFNGDARFSGSGNAPSHASFDLDDLSAGNIVSGSDTSPLAPFTGTLLAGNYHLLARASSASIDPNEGGLGTFLFNLHFADLEQPPEVPEPHGLALVLAGLMACRAVGAARNADGRGRRASGIKASLDLQPADATRRGQP